MKFNSCFCSGIIWYFEPHGKLTLGSIFIHGILTPLPMVYRPPYPWYIDPPTHGILTPYT